MISILIVEDDEMVRLLTKAQLSPLYKITEASNGEEALEILDHEHIDLLIVDIQMPKMNGYELMRTLRDGGDLRPAIMLTAMNSFAHKKEGFASGVDDYMTKPINYEELIWRIEAILRRTQIANEKKIQIGRFTMEQNSYVAQYDGETVSLTNKEFDLLYKLLSYPGKWIFSKSPIPTIQQRWVPCTCRSTWRPAKTTAKPFSLGRGGGRGRGRPFAQVQFFYTSFTSLSHMRKQAWHQMQIPAAGVQKRYQAELNLYSGAV